MKESIKSINKKMDKNEQRIAIAKFHGDIIVNGDWTTQEFIDCGAIHDLKNYLNDRNAIIDVLKTLDHDQRTKFIHELCKICDDDFGNSEISPSDVFDPNEMSQMFLIDCSCEQYCEALLKAVNLWTN
jgi:hypothetical protein